jgi:hypothetical protein
VRERAVTTMELVVIVSEREAHFFGKALSEAATSKEQKVAAKGFFSCSGRGPGHLPCEKWSAGEAIHLVRRHSSPVTSGPKWEHLPPNGNPSNASGSAKTYSISGRTGASFLTRLRCPEKQGASPKIYGKSS